MSSFILQRHGEEEGEGVIGVKNTVNPITPQTTLAADEPLLLALQQLVVGGNLDVQGQLEVHQFLVLSDLPGQVLLCPSQGLLQLADVLAHLLQIDIALGPHIDDFLLQGLFLRRWGKNED